jgi:hypothetical protein
VTSQVLSLLALRWRMVRSPAVRTGLVLLVVFAVGLLLLGALTASAVPLGPKVDSADPLQGLGRGLPPDRTDEIAILIPSALLLLLVTSVIGPVAAGGAYELFPFGSLVAFPVTPRTQARVSLLLSPLNVAWYLQLLLLSVATAYAIRGPYGPGLPLLVLLAFVLLATAVGHCVAWLLVGVRRRRRGRVATRVLLGVAAVVGIWVVWSGRLTDVLDGSPTRRVVAAQAAAARGEVAAWLPLTVGLLLAAGACYLLAGTVAGWAMRRPGDHGADGRTTSPLRRRALPASPYRALLAVDRASVWRSVPLRRGIWVMAALPTAAGLLAGLSWPSITLLPPLVASGAVLLFGVNALALDGSGATWLATLPHDPGLVLRAKRRVVLEVTGAAVAIVVVACSVRAPAPPTPAEVVAVLASATCCAALVTTTALHLSVTRPHRAELQGARDTPAPPGSMALYSLRLAGVTTLLGLLFAASAQRQDAVTAVVLGIGLLAWSAWSWRRTRRRWADPAVRSRIVATVSSG